MCFSIAFHMTSVWTRFKTRPNLRLRRWLVNVLLNGSLWKVCPCPCSVWAHSQNTNTPLFCSSTLQPKNDFFAMVICCLTRRTLAFSEVAMTVVTYSRYPRFFFLFWLNSRGRTACEQRKTWLQVPRASSLHLSISETWLFVHLFSFCCLLCALHTTINFPGELAAGIDQVCDSLYALHSPALRAVWLSG